MKKYIFILLAVLSLSSCGVYQKYERRDLWFVDSLYRRLEVPTDTFTTGSVSWERMFTDPILQEWINLGIKYNSDLKIAQTKVKEAEAALLSARWALLPGANFTASGGVPASFSATSTCISVSGYR